MHRSFLGGNVLRCRLGLPLSVALALAGCRDVTAPPSEQYAAGRQLGMTAQLASEPESPPAGHILQQAPAAPRLEAYQVSFWIYNGEASTITVNYQPGAGELVGQPFLRFDVPKHGLVAGAEGTLLEKDDSVAVTLTIDSLSFAVDFQPAGLLFSTHFPATLAMWYENADPDLNADGVVNAVDDSLKQQFTLRNLAAKTFPWLKASSENDTTKACVSTVLFHFSEYAVTW